MSSALVGPFYQKIVYLNLHLDKKKGESLNKLSCNLLQKTIFDDYIYLTHKAMATATNLSKCERKEEVRS